MKNFTERVREELSGELPSAQCCRRSMLCGILINADCSPGGGIYAKLSGKISTELMLKLLRDTFGREAYPEYSSVVLLIYDVVAEAIVVMVFPGA